MASHIDRILDDVRRSVELTGKSGEKTVFKENVVFTIPCENFEVPDDADLDGAVVDFDWSLKCAEKHTAVDHPSPSKSFWIRLCSFQYLKKRSHLHKRCFFHILRLSHF